MLDFRNAALPLMERLLSQDVMPVIVGGTNYYIESLLWNVLVESVPESEMLDTKLVYERDKKYYECPKAKNDGAISDESAQKRNKTGGASSDECVLKKNNDENVVHSGSVENNNVGLECHDESSDDDDHEKESEVKENLENDGNSRIAWQDSDMPTEDLYQRLLEVDPTSAKQYHPNDRRKIIR